MPSCLITYRTNVLTWYHVKITPRVGRRELLKLLTQAQVRIQLNKKDLVVKLELILFTSGGKFNSREKNYKNETGRQQKAKYIEQFLDCISVLRNKPTMEERGGLKCPKAVNTCPFPVVFLSHKSQYF